MIGYIYMRGMPMRDMEIFCLKANEQSCILDADIISESIGEGVRRLALAKALLITKLM